MKLETIHHRKSDGHETRIIIDTEKLEFKEGYAVVEYTIENDAVWNYSSFIGGWFETKRTYRGIINKDFLLVLNFDTYSMIDNCGNGNFIITGLGHGGDGEQSYVYIWGKHMKVENDSLKEINYFRRFNKYQNLGNGIITINGQSYDVNSGEYIQTEKTDEPSKKLEIK